MFMNLCVWSDILHSGCFFTYSVIEGMMSAIRLHSGCRKSRQSFFVPVLQLSAHSKSLSWPMTVFISSAMAVTSMSGGRCFFGERHIQSKVPLSGCVPEVSRNILYPLSFRRLHRESSLCINGSPPVMTTFFAGVSIMSETMSCTGLDGYSLLFHVFLESHHGQHTSQPPRRMKYAALPVLNPSP